MISQQVATSNQNCQKHFRCQVASKQTSSGQLSVLYKLPYYTSCIICHKAGQAVESAQLWITKLLSQAQMSLNLAHRNKKANDIHEGKWNGLGGKFEAGETPEECVVREVLEESGLSIRAKVAWIAYVPPIQR